MKIIGITGPTGAGKTTALKVLAQMGAAIIDADAVYHQLLASDDALKAALIGRFGDLEDGSGGIDRKKLGALVFADQAALLDLNEITHRFVKQEIDRRLQRAEADGAPAAAVDAIALVESGLAQRCDVTVAVLAPADVRVRRVMAREGISRDYAEKRVSAQQSDAFFGANCTHTLENDGSDTPETFAPRAKALFEQILNIESSVLRF